MTPPKDGSQIEFFRISSSARMLSSEEKRLIGWIFAILFFGALVKAYLHRVKVDSFPSTPIPSLGSELPPENKSR